MTKHFTHLHVHTEYSLLDGAITLPKLVYQAKEQGLKALAITDHGNIFGAVKFFQLCKKEGIKPIIGMEAYVTEDISQKSVEKKYYHKVLLIINHLSRQHYHIIITHYHKIITHYHICCRNMEEVP